MMEQTADKPYQIRAFRFLSIGLNSLFLAHSLLDVLLFLYTLFGQESQVFLELREIMFTEAYMIFYFFSELGLLILLHFKRRRHLLTKTDRWIKTLLIIKYMLLGLFILLIFSIIWIGHDVPL